MKINRHARISITNFVHHMSIIAVETTVHANDKPMEEIGVSVGVVSFTVPAKNAQAICDLINAK